MDIIEAVKTGKNIYELPLRVCYYARVSTDHELQTTSILNQVDYFMKYIKNNDQWVLINGYIDEGISGKDVKNRFHFLQMIKDAKNQHFDLILTKSVSRFARNTIDSIHYTNLLLSYRVGVLFLNDNINTLYSDSEFRLTLMASIAQDELRKLSESVKFGLKQSIDRGVVLGNNNLLGYIKKKGKLVIVEKEAQIVRDIFNYFLKGIYTYTQISQLIYQKYQKQLDPTSIKRILENYKYKGFYCGRKTQVIDYKNSKRKKLSQDSWIIYRDYQKIPPIVEESLWNQAQEIINARKRSKTKTQIEGKYVNKIYCTTHHKMLLHKTKRYKNQCYHYFVCPSCCSLSKNLLDRIVTHHSIKKIIITKTSDIQLDVFINNPNHIS